MDAADPSDLDRLVLARLRQRPLGRRLVERVLGGGLTVREVLDGLPAGLGGETSGVRAEQQAQALVRASLLRLEAQGLVERSQATQRTFLNTKGSRLVLVDRYRARGLG